MLSPKSHVSAHKYLATKPFSRPVAHHALPGWGSPGSLCCGAGLPPCHSQACGDEKGTGRTRGRGAPWGCQGRLLVTQPPAWGTLMGPQAGMGWRSQEGTWGIPADAVGEEVPVDLAQELGQGAGEEGEVELVSDEVPSPAQEIHQALGVGVQLCRCRGRAIAPAPHQTHATRNGVPPCAPTPTRPPGSPHRLVLARQVSSARRAQVARPWGSRQDLA